MRFKKAFTIVELLTVIAVLALLVGLLIPALTVARNAAKVAKQRVQLASIDQALLAFRNDDGDYPPSAVTTTTAGRDYCGAQKLAEAFFGLDLLGFHPSSKFDYDYDLALYQNPTEDNLRARKRRYLELDSVDVVTIDSLYGAQSGQLERNAYVICDVFGQIEVDIGTRIKKVGLPILYFKANPSGLGLVPTIRGESESIYRYTDNAEIVNLGDNQWDFEEFQAFITDPKVIRPLGANSWPHRPDSYILISAGLDGLYGTSDDITNFGQ